MKSSHIPGCRIVTHDTLYAIAMCLLKVWITHEVNVSKSKMFHEDRISYIYESNCIAKDFEAWFKPFISSEIAIRMQFLSVLTLQNALIESHLRKVIP